MTAIFDAAILGTIIAGVICIIVYCIYKAIRKHPLEINKIQPSRAVFCFSLGVAFNLIVTYLLDFIWSYSNVCEIIFWRRLRCNAI
jgi:O-antigen/teichoic acid export membrane protein